MREGKPRESKRTGRMESGISDDWGVIFADEEKELKKEHNEALYLKYKETFDRNAKKWDEAHHEKKLESKRKYNRTHPENIKHTYPYRKDYLLDYGKSYMVKYFDRKKMKDKRKKIICIYGRSGVGKSYAAAHLRSFGVNVICSYTTRPKRVSEKNGVDHWFVEPGQIPPKEELLAYSKYGGYDYYAKKSDLKDGVNVYVVDEIGIMQMMENPDLRLFPVKLIATERNRRKRGVSISRIIRDNVRYEQVAEEDSVVAYRVINNNGTKPDLKRNLSVILAMVQEA